MVWQMQRMRVWLEDVHGLPTAPHILLVARNVLHPEEVKYFLSNAPEGTELLEILRAAFCRWHVEKWFERGKQEAGLGDLESQARHGADPRAQNRQAQRAEVPPDHRLAAARGGQA